jgi:DNA-binding CsgD family transcriptional regulator
MCGSPPLDGNGSVLTPREVLVARLCEALEPEIAAALGISPHTARHHTEQVLTKLGLHSRDDVGDRSGPRELHPG